VHAEGERVILTREEGERREIELVGPRERTAEPAGMPDPVCPQGVMPGGDGNEEPQAPGESVLDELMGGRHE
jgi:hypothetical protein